MFQLNLNTKDLQKKSLLQQSTILIDTDILSDEDETNHSQDKKDQNTTTLKEQTFALQYPTKSDYCNQQVPFLTHHSLSIKNTLIISSSQKIPQ